MKKSRRIARWLHRGRHGVVELALPRQVTPTRAPCDPAQSMTVLLVAPMGIESAVMTAAMLDLGVGRVLRITSTATLRHCDMSIMCPPMVTSLSSVRLNDVPRDDCCGI